MGEKETHRSGDHRGIVENSSSSGNKADIYLTGKGESEHCHVYVDKNGNSGAVHRGQCDSCSDKWAGK